MSDRITFAATVSADGRRIRGSVQLAGERTRRNGEWLEIDPAAVVKADASGAVGRWEHDPHKILGRQSNGTLRLSRTDQGIEYELSGLPKTSYADDALELVNGGYVTGSSFEIDGHRSRFYADPETGERVRVINHIDRITDVSPVSDPAFVNSTAAAFSKESEVTAPATEPVEEPKAAPVTPPPAPKPEPAKKANFSQNETAEATEAFARTLDTNQIEQAMDGIVAASNGDLKGVPLDQYEAYAKVYGERKRVDSEQAERGARMKALHDIRLGRIPKAPMTADFTASDDYKEAFVKYLRTGESHHVEQFAQSVTGDGSQGGFTVPDGFLNRIVERQKAYGGVESVAEILETESGNPIRFPTVDDTANTGAIAAEGAAPASGGADKVFGNVELGAYSYAATGAGNAPLKVSWELLQDSAFNIEDFLARNLGTRLGRAMAADFATGSGSNEPLGVFTKALDTMTATKTRAAAVEMEFQVDSAYRGNAVWLMSDATAFKYRGATDLNGRPLWLPEAESGMTTRPGGILNGYRVVIVPEAGDLVAFGDINEGYIIRRVRGIQILVNPYSSSATRQTEIHAWARADATIKNPNAYSVSSFAGVTADAVA